MSVCVRALLLAVLIALLGACGDDEGGEDVVLVYDTTTTATGDETSDTDDGTGTADTGEDTGDSTSDTGTADTGTGSTGSTGADTDGTADTGGETDGQEALELTVTPPAVDFGSTTIGQSKGAFFVIQNTGTEKLNIVSAKIIDGEGKGFSYTDDAPTGLMVPTEKRNVDLTFVTAKVGSSTATIEFVTQPALPAKLTVFLKAIATVQASNVTTEIYSTLPGVGFGPVLVDDAPSLGFDIVNQSTDPIEISALAWQGGGGPFSFKTATDIPALLGPSTKVEVTATYAPTGAAADAAVLEVTTNSANTPLLLVPFSGTAYTGKCAGKLKCAPGKMDFGAVPTSLTKALTLTCRNAGNGPLLITQVTADLKAADGFEVTVPDTPASLGAGEGIGVQVLFTPKNLVNEAGGSITIKSNDCDNGSTKITVSGAGKEPAALVDCIQPGTFTPKVEWEWTAAEGGPVPGNVHMAPIVVSLDDDDGDGDVDSQDIPEVVFVAHNNALAELNDDSPGVLAAVHGSDGTLMWSSDAAAVPTWGGNIAAVELDGAPGPEIIAIEYSESPAGQKCPNVPAILPAQFCGKYLSGRLLAFHGADGSLFWKSEPFSGAMTDLTNFGAPAVADLDSDGVAEIILGNHAFNGLNGQLLWVGQAGRGNDGHGFMSVVADVDGNGIVNVVAGNTAYNENGSILWTATIGDTHGTAVADFDNNGSLEVFINAPNGNAVIVAGVTGNKIAGPQSTGIIGCCTAAPAVADVAGGTAGLEIVLVADDHLKVYDKDLNLLWERAVNDPTGASGPVTFDVGGDGIAEVIYADADALLVLRGTDGKIMMEAERTSGTGIDLPVVADVDGDGHAEILVAQEGTGAGLRLYGDDGDLWAGARRIWNQHSYASGAIYDSAVAPVGGWTDTLGPLLLRGTPASCK